MPWLRYLVIGLIVLAAVVLVIVLDRRLNIAGRTPLLSTLALGGVTRPAVSATAQTGSTLSSPAPQTAMGAPDPDTL
jgi:hypothetical protein